MVCYNDQRCKRDMVDTCKLFKVLSSIARPRLVLALVVAGLLAISLVYAVPAVANEPEDITASKLTFDDSQVLILGLNARADDEEAEHEFKLSLTNSEAFSEAPTVDVEWFTFNDGEAGKTNSWSPAADGGSAPDYSAVEWFAEPQRSRALGDLADGAVNELDFAINVPQDVDDGSYVVAIVVRDQQSELLAAKPIIINVGINDGDDQTVDLDLAASDFDLGAAQAEVTIANQASWHVSGSLSLRLSDKEDEDNTLNLMLQSLAADFVGIFPDSQQAFLLDGDDDAQKSLEDFLDKLGDLEAELVFLSAADEELESWEVADSIDLDNSEENGDENQAGDNNDTGSQVLTGSTTEPTPSSGIGDILTGSLSLIAAAVGVIILIVLLLFMRRRRQRVVSFGPKTASPTPPTTAQPTTGASLPAAQQPPSADVPASQPAVSPAAPVNPLPGTQPEAGIPASPPPAPLSTAQQPPAAAQPTTVAPPPDAQQPPSADVPASQPAVSPAAPPPAASPAPTALTGIPELPSIEGMTPPAPLTDQLPPSDVDGGADMPPPPANRQPPSA